MKKKLKILFHSNYSRAVTGFGKNLRNVLMTLHNSDEFEVVEAANGLLYGADLKTPWESYGTFPADYSVQAEIKSDPNKERAASYGFYEIDRIIQESKPDIYVGIEDIWAFRDYFKKPWWKKIPCIIWTTLDSLPILEDAKIFAPKCDQFWVWATFAEQEMKKLGYDNVETIHGLVDYSNFFPLPQERKTELRKRHGLEDSFVVGFVFKNQLRKSVPNLLRGFKLFCDQNPEANGKLLLHTDWQDQGGGWDIQRLIRENGVDPNRVLATYVCKACKSYKVVPFQGQDIDCHDCRTQKAMITRNTMLGTTEEQLNEIYNMMDVYCHPFTSGGQELPIQEAKAVGLITLVTDYSCGTDSAYPHQGGIPLEWHKYEEPHTQFIKATTIDRSIAERLFSVWKMSPDDKEKFSKKAIEWVHKEFSIPVIAEKLKEKLSQYSKTTWDFDFTPQLKNLDFVPDDSLEDVDWLLSIYKNMMMVDLSQNDMEIKQGLELIKNDGRSKVFEHIRNHCLQFNNEQNAKKITFEDLLGDEGKDQRIAVVIPESAGDVLMINSLIDGFHDQYPDCKIYVITKPEYFDFVNDHPHVFRLIPYQPLFDNLLFLEGQAGHKGYFKCAFLPFIGTQRILDYLHNGQDNIAYDLCTW